MLADRDKEQEADEEAQRVLEAQIKAEEEERVKQIELQKMVFNDNQFWNRGIGDQYDIDELMKELD